MTTTESTKSEDIPLEDIEKLLEAEDPEFSKSLEEVKTVETDKAVEIEATVPVDGLSGEDKPDHQAFTRLQVLRFLVRGKVQAFRQRMRERRQAFFLGALIFIKTRPKEFALYAFALARHLVKDLIALIGAFGRLERGKKLLFFLLLCLSAVTVAILLANFRGVWLPNLTQPMLTDLTKYADSVETFDPKEEGESFYSAFPQERFEFLFDKIKVNLRRTVENPLPMGAFEIIALLDSRDTAIEVHDRQIEFSDLLQRVLEGETFADLATELGKNKVKARLKRELNQALTQGWVKEISFKAFILKP